jgi:hypothetical protein
LPRECYLPRPPHLRSFQHPNIIWWRTVIAKRGIMQFCSTSASSVFGLNVFLSTCVWNTVSLCSSLNVRDCLLCKATKKSCSFMYFSLYFLR